MKKIIVASKNPVKINSTKAGFIRMFPDIEFDVVGISVPSGVSDQPLSEVETLLGAKTRAENARKVNPDADFWVGLEGGLEESSEGMGSFAWIVTISKDGLYGKGRTGSFFLPEKVVSLIKQGKELGEADDIVFKRENSKQKSGSIGILTGDVVTRESYYETAVIFSLIPFNNLDLY